MLLSQVIPHLLSQIITGDAPINRKTRITLKCGCGVLTTLSSEVLVRTWKNRLEYKCTTCWRQDPEYRSRMAAANKATWGDPSHKAKIAPIYTNSGHMAKMKVIWSSPEFSAKVSAGNKAKWSNPEFKVKSSEAFKLTWQSQEYKDKIAILRSDPAYRANMSTANKLVWDDPAHRERASHISKSHWADATYRSKATAIWQDPEYRSQMAIIRANQPRISSLQTQLYKYLDDLGVNYEPENESTAIGYYSFDCLIPSIDLTKHKHLLIECQGDYWHSLPKHIRNDKSKFTYIERYFPDHEIMYIWEHEFGTAGRVLDRLKLKLGIAINTHDFDFADIIIKTPSSSELKSFLDTYHYIGKSRGGNCYGAYLGTELIACIVYSSPLRQNTAGQFGIQSNEILELSRLCIHPCYHKKNFGSWLISKTIKQLQCQLIVAYADTTVGHTGAVYKASNFKLHHEVPADYWYADADGFVMHKRTLYGKAIKMKMVEAQYAQQYNYTKVWGGPKYCYIRNMHT